MAYPKKYEVIGSEVVYNTPPGKTFVLEGPVTWKHNPEVSWLNEDALIAGGMLRLVSQAGEKCELCDERGTAKDKKAEYTAAQLREHYAKDHPGYEAPREG